MGAINERFATDRLLESDLIIDLVMTYLPGGPNNNNDNSNNNNNKKQQKKQKKLMANVSEYHQLINK